MLSRVKIQFREEIGATKFIYCGNQKAILDSDSIKSSIVCATTPSTILFLDQKDRRGEGTGVGADDPFLKHFGNHILYLFLLAIGVSILLDFNKVAPFQQRNSMIMGSSWLQAYRGGKPMFIDYE